MKHALLMGILLIHALLVVHYLPLNAVFSNAPFVNDDYPLHTYKFVTSHSQLMQGKVVYYDRNLQAGYSAVYGTYRDANLLGLALPLGSVMLLKAYILIANLLIPLILYFASRNFGLKDSAIVTTALAVVVWNLSAVFHSFVYFGLMPFFFTVALWFLALSLFYRFTATRNLGHALAAGSLLVYTTLVHPYSLFLSIPTSLLFLAYTFFRGRKWHFALLAALVVGGFTGTLLIPGLSAGLSTPLPLLAFHQQHGLEELKNTVFNRPFFTLLLLAGSIGCVIMEKRLMLFLLIFLTPALLIGFFGGSTPIWFIQPERFVFIAALVLIIPAGLFFSKLFAKARLGVALIALLFVAYCYLSPYSLNEQLAYRFSTELPQSTQRLVDWLKLNTDTSGRIMLEGSGCRTGHIYGGHSNALFPLMINREFAFRAYPYVNKISHTLQFSEGDLACDGVKTKFGPEMNEPIQLVNCSVLSRIAQVFNVHWIVAWSNVSIEKFEQCRGFKHAADVGRFSIFEPLAQSSFFLKGNGTISWGPTGLLVNTSSNNVVLKYSWEPNFRVEPSYALVPEQVNIFKDYSVRFVRVENRGGSFRIYY